MPTARGDIRQVHDYWLRGGYPEPWLKPGARFRATWMSQYVKTYVERDVGLVPIEINIPTRSTVVGWRPCGSSSPSGGCRYGLVITNDSEPRLLDEAIPFSHL
jgi:hypothetical protein